jgi:hypothetical protein
MSSAVTTAGDSRKLPSSGCTPSMRSTFRRFPASSPHALSRNAARSFGSVIPRASSKTARSVTAGLSSRKLCRGICPSVRNSLADSAKKKRARTKRFEHRLAALLIVQPCEQPGSSVSPDTAGSSYRDAHGRRRLLCRQSAEVPQFDQSGRRLVNFGKLPERLIQRMSSEVAMAGMSARSRRTIPAPRLRLFLRRALSTRIRRMASAAAAKKWPRELQCRTFSTSTRRRYAS